MASNYAVQRKWIENFGKSPLVDRKTKSFNKSIAKQLFYGRSDDSYPSDYPHGFERFYNASYELDRKDTIDTVVKYLHFIGVNLRKEAILVHLQGSPADFHTILKKSYYLLKQLAHQREDLDTGYPFRENQHDIQYFISIENGQGQLTIFDAELPELYNKYVTVPEKYDDDPLVKDLFNKIEVSNDSFFITGKAGTGKSTFVHYFTQKTAKRVLMTAFTGIAAINVGGVTLHSFFRFPFRPILPDDPDLKILGKDDQRRKVIEDIDTIVIDEVSMLRADLLQAIDFSLRKNGGNPNKLFGGKQIIFVGDIFQLPPVTDAGNDVEQYLFNERYDSHYFFDCDAYRQLAPKFYEFKKSHRQREDLEFVTLLDKVRDCTLDEETLNKLNSRYDLGYTPNTEEFFITLATNNYIVDAENDRRLQELNSTLYQFGADVKGDFGNERFPSKQTLALKKGAQVVFIRNDVSGQRRWVNGTIGKVEFIADDIIEVKLPDGSVHKLEKETWDHRGYKYDRSKGRVVSEAKGTFTQYPIKLAWAITIHKSQGLTFNNVIIDLGSGAFVNGQLYTALSRCRTLKGIVLKRRIKREDVIQDQRLMDFYRMCLAAE